jgi:hypothetical protein
MGASNRRVQCHRQKRFALENFCLQVLDSCFSATGLAPVVQRLLHYFFVQILSTN